MILSTGGTPSEADLLRSMLEAKEALRQSREWMSAVLESITDGLAVFDEHWTITYLNQRAGEMLRTATGARDTLVGRNLWQEVPELLGTVAESQFRVAMAERRIDRKRTCIQVPLERDEVRPGGEEQE